MPLIRDLLPIPAQVNRGDFVLSLAAGIQDPKGTLDSYVVTPQIEAALREALAFIRSAVDENHSKATYLHGSFGSGKSHFMAVLSLLLARHSAVRSKEPLLPLVDQHRWVEGRKFLLIPYHMIGQPNMETAILGGYAEHVMRLHPEATLPGVFLADDILTDARNLRTAMGDTAFFALLNKGGASGGGGAGGGGGGGWGELGTDWDAPSFDAAA